MTKNKINFQFNEKYTFWLNYFNKVKDKTDHNFDENLQELAIIESSQEFWSYYKYLKRPDNLSKGCEIILFKSGIKPVWEDKCNKDAGRFIIPLKKDYISNKFWEEILIKFLYNYKETEKINGVILNIKNNEILISLWTRIINETETNDIKNWIYKSLNLPESINISYKLHHNNFNPKKKPYTKKNLNNNNNYSNSNNRSNQNDPKDKKFLDRKIEVKEKVNKIENYDQDNSSEEIEAED